MCLGRQHLQARGAGGKSRRAEVVQRDGLSVGFVDVRVGSRRGALGGAEVVSCKRVRVGPEDLRGRC